MMPELVMKELYEKTYDSSLNKKNEEKKSFNFFAQFVNRLYYYQLKKIAKKVDYNMYLESNKDICNGKIVIKNTRIQPITIMNYFVTNYKKYNNDADLFIKDIKENYPTLAEIEILVSILYCLKVNKYRKS